MLKKIRSKLPRRLQRSKIWEKPSKDSQARLSFDQKLILQQNNKRKLPSLKQIKYLSGFFSARERFVIFSAVFAVIFAIALSIFFLYARFVEPIPAVGGSYREALIGTPLYINPILASTNDVDLDLSHLMFSGLLRYDSNLELQNDMAESWEISEDGKEYTVKLRENIYWHDHDPKGDQHPVTVDDVIFTYRAIQETTINSPLLLSMQDTSMERIDDRTVKFILEEPFRPFASLLTIGIIPQHLWSNIPATNIRLAELNIKPIGSGPWKFEKLEKDKQGTIHSYTLVPFEDYHGTSPYITELSFRFYSDFGSAIEALNSQKVEGVSFIPIQLAEDISSATNYKTNRLQLPQYTAVFFNQENNAALQDLEVRQALAYSIDRNRVLQEALNGLGTITDGPLLEGMPGYDPEFEGFPYNPVEAQALLDKAGWETIGVDEYIEHETAKILKERELAREAVENASEDETQGEDEVVATEEAVVEEPVVIDTGNQSVFRKKGDKILEMKITTVDQPENVRAAEIIRDAWQTIGIKVDLEIISISLFTNTILPSRDYDALLYGQILNVFPDLYTFWHSSQIEYPGLNLAGYSDKDADELLLKARQTTSYDEQAEHYREFQTQLDEDLSAIFLYSPKYSYLISAKINGFNVERISVPADRWNNIYEWYIKTERKIMR